MHSEHRLYVFTVYAYSMMLSSPTAEEEEEEEDLFVFNDTIGGGKRQRAVKVSKHVIN